MDMYAAWSRALKNTEIIRPRAKALMTFADTTVPYILLSESSINVGDTVVRKGEVVVQKPSLILPPSIPQFEGFEFNDKKQSLDENSIVNFLLVRGVHLPSFKYNNTTHTLDVHEGSLNKAVSLYKEKLQWKENVHTGLVVGPEDCWQFSVLIYICSQIIKNTDVDIRNLFKDHKKDQ